MQGYKGAEDAVVRVVKTCVESSVQSTLWLAEVVATLEL